MKNRNSKQGEVIRKTPALPLTPHSWQFSCIREVLMGWRRERSRGRGAKPRKQRIGSLLSIIFQYRERRLPSPFNLIGISINWDSVKDQAHPCGNHDFVHAPILYACSLIFDAAIYYSWNQPNSGNVWVWTWMNRSSYNIGILIVNLKITLEISGPWLLISLWGKLNPGKSGASL